MSDTPMSELSELAQLRAEVRLLRDRQDVLDCVMRQARGHDRHDLQQMADVYHHDGVDEHGPVVSAGPDYGTYANSAHSRVFVDHLHNITTHTCDIEGDVAHAETYVIGTMRVKDGRTVSLIGGRYLDRLERRDGVWRIALRRCTIEWVMNGDTSMIGSGAFAGFIRSTWGSEDASYARPLTMDTPVDRW